MKRLLCLLLILMLTCSHSLAASSFTATDARSARLAALECLKATAFSAEYGSRASDGIMLRWDGPIHIYVQGKPTQQDLQQLDDFLLELAFRAPMLPNITRVTDRAKANIILSYVPLKQLPDYVTSYVEGNWGMFYYSYTDYVIRYGEIGIATDVTNQKQRNHLMREELVGLLGLRNDHELYKDSIVYQPWTETQTLSEVDWLMMNMLYHPDLSPGMTLSTACDILYQKIMAD